MNAALLEKRQNRYRQSKPAFLGRGIDRLTNPVGATLAGMVPNWIVEKVLNGIDRASARAPLGTFTHDRDDLAACIDAAEEVESTAKRLNAASGAGAGFFGAITASADIPTTIGLALANIRDTGRAYGFDGIGDRERLFRLQILELAATPDRDSRQPLIDQLMAGIETGGALMPFTDKNIEPIVDQVVERVSRAVAFAAFRSRLGMVVPLVGSAVGGIVNAQFQGDVAKAARFAFEARRLKALEE
ncbi:EcsC family protein [Erythrobacter sp.]|jgi:hypothetical protein|uniref:EcsC family protein n=1 Tax=Erythrobacter sp. TaxID=1042 RepID=UPI002EBA0C5F|nr:EcsC family protein [Erythrobacter sp.]